MKDTVGRTFVQAHTFRVATYNVENYLDETASRCCVKSVESKAKVRECIRALRPDVLALQEMGSIAALTELRAALQAEGLDFPHWEHVAGSDANLQLAILSRFPICARRPHTDDSFELSGQCFRVRRGFAEVDVQVCPNYQFTLLAAHLKSKHPEPDEDVTALRLEEAKLLRSKVDGRLATNAEAKLIVLGDFNDTEDSATLKTIRGTGAGELFDTRPGERGVGANLGSELAPHGPAWTTFREHAGYYERIDYLLISQALRADWVTAESYVPHIQGWKTGSDHRPVLAAFRSVSK